MTKIEEWGPLEAPTVFLSFLGEEQFWWSEQILKLF